MKKLLSFILTPLLVLAFAGLSFAYTAVNTGKITPSYQTASGGLQTGTGGNTVTISGVSTVITGLAIYSGSTANVVELWNTSANGPVLFETTGAQTNSNSNAVFEGGAAANTTQFYDFSQTPIRCTGGVESAGSNITSGNYIVYTAQYP